MRDWVLALILVLASGSVSYADVIGIGWSEPISGSWWDAGRWNPMTVPNNGPNTYEVTISEEADVLLNSANITRIDSLVVEHRAAVLAVESPLEIVVGGVSIDGELSIGSALRFHSDEATLSGSGMILLVGGAIEGVGGPSGEAELTIQRSVSGSGSLGNIEIINQTFIAAENGVLSIFPNDNGFTNDGVLVASVVPPPAPAIASRLELGALGRGNYFNTNGLISAVDTTEVRLIGARIFGGRLESIGTGRVTATSQSQLLSGVEFAGVLDINAGSTVEVDVFVQNEGAWNLNGEPGLGANLLVDSPVDFSGGGEIMASDTNSNGIGGSGVLINEDHMISGAVRIEVQFINLEDGVLLADAGAVNFPMTLATLDMVHHGVALASQGGTLQVHGNEVLGNGSWRADGGNLLTKSVNIGTCGTLRVDPGHLELENAKFRALSFRLGADSSLTAFKGGQFGSAPSEFRLTSGLVVETQDEAAWDVEWFPETKFIFYGGLAAEGCEASSSPGTPAIEIAGTDGGAEFSYFSDNFEIPRVVIGPGAQVQLADVVDNGNRNGPEGDTEALYVRTLEFSDSAGRLMLNGLPIYYQFLIGDESQIVDDSPADECGDATEDGLITASDALAALQAAVGVIVCPVCICDVDDSGATTATDALRLLQAAVGQPVDLSCSAC